MGEPQPPQSEEQPAEISPELQEEATATLMQ